VGKLDNVELHQGDLESLPIDDNSLDVAVLFLVLHYVADPQRVFNEAARVLARRGRLLLVDMLPHERNEYRERMGHVWQGFAKNQLSEWMKGAGFGTVDFRALPIDPNAAGPALFTATGRS